MKFFWKWLTPIFIQIISMSSKTLGSPAASLSNIGSIHLVFNVSVSLAASSTTELLSEAIQPRRRLDGGTFINLTNQELSFPIMPL